MLEQSAYGNWPMQYADIEGNVREAQPGLRLSIFAKSVLLFFGLEG